MDTQEIDSTLDELENRLDRLRALYEQYFLGIEKIEPAVARKDVDRRFWLLRRTQIRNTARRWRLQVLIQRYNTFQQYWTRICREIENGTYVRHLLKAKKNLGAEPMTWAAKKRMGLLRRGHVGEPPPTDSNADSPSDGSNGSDGTELANGGAVATRDEEVRGTPPPVEKTAPKPPRPRGGTVSLNLDDLGPLDLDFDDESAAAHRVQARPIKPAPSPVPRAAVPPPVPPRAAAPAIPKRVEAAGPPAARVPLPPPRVDRAVPPPHPAAARPPAERPAVPALKLPNVARPLLPAAPAPAAAPATRAAVPAAVTQGGPAVPSAGVSDERVRKLHTDLIEAKRKLNQGDNVSFDALAKSLREAEKKLRALHVGRNVDFQIVVKDGKPIVKPVVRK